MHWLLLLALLSSTTGLKNTSGDALNRMAEDTLRRQIGPVNSLRVDAVRRDSRQVGDFDRFNVTVDGASLDQLLALADRAENQRDAQTGRSLRRTGAPLGRNSFDIGDIFGGNLPGDAGGLLKGDLGDILGGIFGGALKGGIGRIGSVHLQATNFTLQGVGYDALSADLGEIRFDWSKALRGQFDIQSWQPGNLSLSLRSDQAQRFIAPRLPSIRNLSLRFDAGRAVVGGRSDYYGISVPFEAGGRLSVRANQVFADDIALSVARLRLPGFVVKELTDGVNPLYDFDPQRRWPLAVNLQTAGTQTNALQLSGGLQWVGFNRDRTSQPTTQPQYNPPVQPPPYRAPQPDYVLQ